MSYKFFFLCLCGVATVVFLAIFEAGWLARENQNLSHNTTEIVPQQHSYAVVSIKKENLPFDPVTGEVLWTSDPETTTVWVTFNDTPTAAQETSEEIQPSTLKTSVETESAESIPSESPTTTLSEVTLKSEIDSFTSTKDDSCVQKNLTKETDIVKWQKTAQTCEAWFIDLHTMCSGVDIIIEKIKLNQDEYLIIAPNVSRLLDEENPIITWQLKSEKKYRMMGSGTVYLQLVTEANSTSGTLYFTYDCYGKGTVTTESPTTEVTSTTGPEVNQTITVYLGGKSQYEFNATRDDFQGAVSEMANKYCGVKNISLITEAIPSDTQFHYIGPCMITWPDSDKCVVVEMAVSLNTTRNVYALTRAQLRDMWNQYADQYLTNLGLTVYSVPDDDFNLLLWVGVSLGVLVVFILLLGIISYCQPFRVYNRMKYKEPEEQTPRVTELYPTDSAIFYEPDAMIEDLPPKSPGADSSTDDVFEVRSSVARLDTIPKYGPSGTGAALHFFGRTHNERGFQDLELVAEEVEETKSPARLSTTRNKPTPYGSSLDAGEEIDTSKTLYMPQKRNSLYKSLNHYEDEPKGYKNLAYTDDEVQGEKTEKSPRNSEENQQNIYGTTLNYQANPKSYDNFAYRDNDRLNEANPRHSLKRNSLFLQEKEIPPVIEEEEVEEVEENPKVSISETKLPSPRSSGSLADGKEDDKTELQDTDHRVFTAF